MPAPKSVTKLKVKDGKVDITYESNLDAAQYYLFELNRAALRDVGRFVARVFREAFYQHFGRHTGNAGRSTKYKVISGKSTIYPRVQIGLKPPKGRGFYAYFQEFGTSDGIPRLGLLTHAVEDNVAEIVKIESQYLSGLSDEAARLDALINEDDMEGDADDE